MARSPILAAGGIVLRPSRPPQIAVVRLRKGEWVLPKGKLDDGETPRDAAMREVLEETGYDVSVHEFLGTLVYDAGGRSKIVHYWRMETQQGRPTRELMRDVIAVDWLPLEGAVERLSRDHERAFLANVGPLALEAAALARRSREVKTPAPLKRQRRRTVVAKPAPTMSPPVAPLPDVTTMTEQSVVRHGAVGVIERKAIEHRAPSPADDAIDAFVTLADRSDVASAEAVHQDETERDDLPAAEAGQGGAVGVMQRVRGWLRRAV